MTTLITIPQSPIALHTLSWPGPKDGSTNSAKGILSCGISGCKDLPFLDLQDNLLKVPCRWPTDPSPKHIQKSFHIFPHHPSIPRYSKYSTPSLPPSFRVTAPRAPDICTATTHLGHAAMRSNAQHVEVHRGSSRFIGLQPRCGGKVSPCDCRAKVAPSSAKTSRNCPTYLRQKDEK